MISPSSPAEAVTRRDAGSDARAMTSEWYRAAQSGVGSPAKTLDKALGVIEALVT